MMKFRFQGWFKNTFLFTAENGMWVEFIADYRGNIKPEMTIDEIKLELGSESDIWLHDKDGKELPITETKSST